MNATTIPNAVSITCYGNFPGTLVHWLETDYDGTYEAYREAPVALTFQNRQYVKTSHNSDSRRICYRTDGKCAMVAR